jgi:hypothetical protein
VIPTVVMLIPPITLGSPLLLLLLLPPLRSVQSQAILANLLSQHREVKHHRSWRSPEEAGDCNELPPARIWSSADQVPSGGSIGPVPVLPLSGEPPQFALVGRSYHGLKQVKQVMSSLVCFFAVVPQHIMEVVIVLDSGHDGELLAKCILEQAQKHGFGALRVALEAKPYIELESPGSMFVGALEGSKGKDRSQYSNFIADRYTKAPIIGFIDAEVCFQMPLLPEYIVSDRCLKGGGGSSGGVAIANCTRGAGERHVHNFAEGGGSSWGNDDWFLNTTTAVDVMYPDRMPIFVWAEDLKSLRSYVTSQPGRHRCFDARFGELTNQPKRAGFVHPNHRRGKPRTGFSQFNIITNYMLYFHPEKYFFHMPTSDRRPFLKRLSTGLKRLHASGGGGGADFATRLAFISDSSVSAPGDDPVPCVGRNGVPLAHTLRYSCCHVYPQLRCANLSGVEWERERTLGYNPTEGEVYLNPRWTDQVRSRRPQRKNISRPKSVNE